MLFATCKTERLSGLPLSDAARRFPTCPRYNGSGRMDASAGLLRRAGQPPRLTPFTQRVCAAVAATENGPAADVGTGS